MNVLIDQARMALLRKHRSHQVLANLAWIECHEDYICIIPIDQMKTLSQFTEMEIRMLYANLTGCEFPQNRYPALLQVVWDLLTRAEEDKVNADEVEAQAAYIKPNVPQKYEFVAGAKTPGKVGDLFAPDPVEVPRNKNEELMALKGEYTIEEEVEPRKEHPETKPTVDKADTVVTDKPAPPPGTELNRADKKKLIWDTATAYWKAAGSPTEVKRILAVRKEVMDTLEVSHGITRSSMSSSLGGWQKELFQ